MTRICTNRANRSSCNSWLPACLLGYVSQAAQTVIREICVIRGCNIISSA